MCEARKEYTPARTVAPARGRTLVSIDTAAWQALADSAAEPNGYYLPAWRPAIAASGARVGALIADRNDGRQLTGLIPVVSFREAYRLPLPALVGADRYSALGTPLLDRTNPDAAAEALLRDAETRGVRALVLPRCTLDGPVFAAFQRVLARRGQTPRIVNAYLRATLDATQEAEATLRAAVSAGRLKEWRRLERRLGEQGPISVHLAQTPDDIAPAIEIFLTLEASGWKGRAGTAMAQNSTDAAALRSLSRDLAAQRAIDIVTLCSGDAPVTSGIVVRHLDRAFFFKLGYDERYARFSPGVLLTLAVTRHLCSDPAITSADSTASADHPMIDAIWRERLAVGDVVLPLVGGNATATIIATMLKARHHARAFAKRLLRR